MFGSFWFITNVDLPKEAALEKNPKNKWSFPRKACNSKNKLEEELSYLSFKSQKVRINYFRLNWCYSRFATFGSLKINKSS